MRLLALETATLAGGAALIEDGRLVGESRLNIALTHSERLMAVVDRVLQDCGWDVASLDALAVSIGPGSFTGLRVGAATAKGLALALEIPVAPVPTLDALAATLPFADAAVCPLLAARRDEVYCSLYRWSGSAMERQWEYLALSPEALAERLQAPVIVLGDGVAACRPFSPGSAPGCARPIPCIPCRRPRRWARSGTRSSPRAAASRREQLAPLYLRPSEAELKARHA